MRISRLKLSRKKNPRGYIFAPFLLLMSRFRMHFAVGVGFFCLLLLGLSWQLGYVSAFLASTSNTVARTAGKFGYRFSDIYIQGRTFTNTQDILTVVNMHRGESSFKYGPTEIKERLEKMPWIAHADVRRELPGALHIKLTERKAIALWQHQQRFYLVDAEGMIIQSPMLKQFEGLPVVVGQDAPQQTPVILSLLSHYPEIVKRTTAIVRINKRRWDLMLGKNLTIKLPETHIEVALARLNFLLEGKKINLEELMAIDLRLPKQLIAKVSPHTAIRLKLKGVEA